MFCVCGYERGKKCCPCHVAYIHIVLWGKICPPKLTLSDDEQVLMFLNRKSKKNSLFHPGVEAVSQQISYIYQYASGVVLTLGGRVGTTSEEAEIPSERLFIWSSRGGWIDQNIDSTDTKADIGIISILAR